MSSGPEHYKRAEQMLATVADAGGALRGDDADADRHIGNTIAAAQVHATLALAAALPAIGRWVETDDIDRAWTEATAPDGAR